MRMRLLSVGVVAVLAGSMFASGAVAKPFDPGSGSVTCGTATVNFSPAKLWPPNHKLVDVTFTSTAPFTVGPVTSDEDGIEKGSTAGNEPDFVITDASGGTAAGDNAVVQLRAERNSKPKDGRTYTITVSCTSNQVVSTANATVFVPHSRKKA